MKSTFQKSRNIRKYRLCEYFIEIEYNGISYRVVID